MGKVVKKATGLFGGLLGKKRKKSTAEALEEGGPQVTGLSASERSEATRGRPRFAGSGTGGGLGNSGGFGGLRGRILGERLGG